MPLPALLAGPLGPAIIQGGAALLGSGIQGIGAGMSKNDELEYMRQKDEEERKQRERELQLNRQGAQRADYWKSIDALAGNAAAGAEKARMYNFATKVFG